MASRSDMGNPPQLQARAENLALIYQELLTAIVRLKSGAQQVTDAALFRNQVLQTLRAADERAKARAYTDEDIELAVFAVVAFLDETILNLRQPAFAEWVRRPLQEELFGRHVAGETFFQHLDMLLGRRDAPETADVLEIHQLSMLLGYLGKYSLLARAELRALLGRTGEKIERIRQSGADLSPNWAPPAGALPAVVHDPWIKRLRISAAATAGLALLLLMLYKLMLGSGAAALRDLTARGGRP
jgi:type VI secretion system protein ImpK